MYKILDVIKLNNDISEENLKQGCLGTIVDVLSSFPKVIYEIEFCNEYGETITTLALGHDDISLYDVS